MIAPLRVRHRRMVTVLAVVVPVCFAYALAARPDWPVVAVGERDELTLELEGDLVVHARTLVVDGRRTLELEPVEDPQRPDLLVYATNTAGPVDGLPDDAWLLGALAGTQRRAFELPSGAEVGRLVFYSLAQREVVGSAAFPRGGE